MLNKLCKKQSDLIGMNVLRNFMVQCYGWFQNYVILICEFFDHVFYKTYCLSVCYFFDENGECYL